MINLIIHQFIPSVSQLFRRSSWKLWYSYACPSSCSSLKNFTNRPNVTATVSPPAADGAIRSQLFSIDIRDKSRVFFSFSAGDVVMELFSRVSLSVEVWCERTGDEAVMRTATDIVIQGAESDVSQHAV